MKYEAGPLLKLLFVAVIVAGFYFLFTGQKELGQGQKDLSARLQVLETMPTPTVVPTETPTATPKPLLRTGSMSATSAAK